MNTQYNVKCDGRHHVNIERSKFLSSQSQSCSFLHLRRPFIKRRPCEAKIPADRNKTPVSPTTIINLSIQITLPVFLVCQSDLRLIRSYIFKAASLYLATGLIGCHLNTFYV
jgi:hypothetical protein